MPAFAGSSGKFYRISSRSTTGVNHARADGSRRRQEEVPDEQVDRRARRAEDVGAGREVAADDRFDGAADERAGEDRLGAGRREADDLVAGDAAHDDAAGDRDDGPLRGSVDADAEVD